MDVEISLMMLTSYCYSTSRINF